MSTTPGVRCQLCERQSSTEQPRQSQSVSLSLSHGALSEPPGVTDTELTLLRTGLVIRLYQIMGAVSLPSPPLSSPPLALLN